MSSMLLKALQNPALYDHPVTAFQVIETHVSWVLLTGAYAYKIKKPVDFDFLNYSTLALRQYYCQEELRLNRQLAPEIYHDVVAIYGTEEQPDFNTQGSVIEYAVKMREFPQSTLFSALLARGELTATLIEQVAKIIAEFHAQAQIAAAASSFGNPEHVHAPVVQNFEQILPLLKDAADIEQLNKLSRWADEQYQLLKPVFAARKAQGFVRECHGDIYLNNIILWEERPVIFDCIEFNEEFRWTDVMADIGFLAMDLEDNGQPALAHQLINHYLKYSGDYAGLKVLPYYQAYRAVVRAKVGLFRLYQDNLSLQQQTAIQQTYRSYMNLAERYTKAMAPALMMTHGFSGSGKSTLAKAIIHEFNAIHISADIERKRNAGLTFAAKTNSAVNSHLYSAEVTAANYQRLADLARLILNAGYSVIVDATCLKLKQRELFKAVARQLKVPFLILSCQAPAECLQQAITRRTHLTDEPSEAYPAVLAMQMETHEALTRDEQNYTIVINTHLPVEREQVLAQIEAVLGR